MANPDFLAAVGTAMLQQNNQNMHQSLQGQRDRDSRYRGGRGHQQGPRGSMGGDHHQGGPYDYRRSPRSGSGKYY